MTGLLVEESESELGINLLVLLASIFLPSSKFSKGSPGCNLEVESNSRGSFGGSVPGSGTPGTAPGFLPVDASFIYAYTSSDVGG